MSWNRDAGPSSIYAPMVDNSDFVAFSSAHTDPPHFSKLDKNRKSIAKEGGLDIIIECLKVGQSSPHLLSAACWCIRNISVEGLSPCPTLF